MYSYEITFTVNGHRTSSVVRANSDWDARKILTAQYPGSKIQIIYVKKI